MTSIPYSIQTSPECAAHGVGGWGKRCEGDNVESPLTSGILTTAECSAQLQLAEPPADLLPEVLPLRRDSGLKATHVGVSMPLNESMPKGTAICVGCPNEFPPESVCLDTLAFELH